MVVSTRNAARRRPVAGGTRRARSGRSAARRSGSRRSGRSGRTARSRRSPSPPPPPPNDAETEPESPRASSDNEDLLAGGGGSGGTSPPEPRTADGSGEEGTQPTGPGAFDPGEPKSWETLVDESEFASASIALALVGKCSRGRVSWSACVRPFADVNAFNSSMSTSEFKYWVRRQSEAMPPKFYLAVIGNKVQVVYGLKGCYPLGHTGERYVALCGERDNDGGVFTYPKLIGLFGVSLPNQYQHLRPTEVAARSEEDIKAALEADPGLSLVDPVSPGQEGNGETIGAWPLLEISPLLAIFFFKGLPLREAFRMILILKRAVGDRDAERFKPLLHFGRAALTSNGASGADRVSSLQGPWTEKAPRETDALWEWYKSLLQTAVPEALVTRSPPRERRDRSVTFGADAGAGEEAGSEEEDHLDESAATLVRALNRYADCRSGFEPQSSLTNQGKYAGFELTILCRAAGFPPPFEGYTQEQLPQFWRELAPYRKKSPSTRNYIDTYVVTHWRSDRSYSFLPTTQTVSDLTSVTLHGGDKLILWENRHKGISPLALQPLREGTDGAEKRQEYLNYEGTWDNHTPQEREQMTRLSQGQVRFATSREELYQNVDFSHELLVLLFGSSCPLVEPNREFRDICLKVDRFVGYTRADFAALQWAHHQAWRYFFLGEGMGHMQALTSQVRLNQRRLLQYTPPQLQAAFQPPGGPAPPHHSGAGDPGSSNPGHKTPRKPAPTDADPGESARKKKKRNPSGARWAASFAAEIKRGNDQTKQGFVVNGRSVCPDARSLEEMLGPGFMALVPAGKSPCLRHHLFGACTYGDRCSNLHELNGEPSAEILSGIKNRLTARIDALIASHPKE